jgi:hypothetical protein
MRTQLICAVALGLSAVALPALAQDSEDFTVRTTVPGYCSSLGTTAVALDLGELTNAVGQVVDTFVGDTDTSWSGYYCNGPSKVTVEAEPLLRTPSITVGDAGSFTDRVDYVATVDWNAVQGAANSADANATELTAATANTGVFTLTVSDPSTTNNRRPVEGDYAGAVRLTVALTN